MKILDEDYSVK